MYADVWRFETYNIYKFEYVLREKKINIQGRQLC